LPYTKILVQAGKIWYNLAYFVAATAMKKKVLNIGHQLSMLKDFFLHNDAAAK